MNRRGLISIGVFLVVAGIALWLRNLWLPMFPEWGNGLRSWTNTWGQTVQTLADLLTSVVVIWGLLLTWFGFRSSGDSNPQVIIPLERMSEDDCEPVFEARIEKIEANRAEPGGGGVENFLYDYTVYFGGRHENMAELDAWLSQDEHPFGLLVAPAGYGKSALVANWLERIKGTERAIVVYHPVSLRYGTNGHKQTLRSFLNQLARTAISHVDDADLPKIDVSYGSEDASLLSAQFREILRRPMGWTRPLLVVLDGLDEFADQLNRTEIRTVDMFPNELARGIHILAVARGESDETRDAWRGALGWERSPVQSFSLGKLSRADVLEMVSQLGSKLEQNSTRFVAEQVYQLSKNGDPLVASLWIDWLAKHSNQLSPSLLEDLGKQDPDINGYIQGIFSQLEPILNNSAKPIFEVLSLARGPLAHHDLQALGIEVESSQLSQLVGQSGRLIVRVSGRDCDKYVFSHSRIRQAIQKKHFSDKRKPFWLDRFHWYGKCTLRRLQAASDQDSIVVSDYILAYYAEHLSIDRPAGFESSLLALVNRAWQEARYKSAGSYDGYLEDLERVIAISKEIGDLKATAAQPMAVISDQLKALVNYAHILSLSDNIPPLLPALLVTDDIWSPIQALAHIQRITDPSQRAQSLVSLLTVDMSNHKLTATDDGSIRSLAMSSLLSSIDQISRHGKQDEGMLYDLLLNTLPFVQREHAIKALKLAEIVQRPIWRARLIAGLLPQLSDRQKELKATIQIVEDCSKIDESLCSDDIPYIFPLFSTLSSNLSMDVLRESLAQARKTGQVRSRHSLDNSQPYMIILKYLSWHIEDQDALSFVEILLEHDSPPYAGEKICRFARRLDDSTAYHIAWHLFSAYLLSQEYGVDSYRTGSRVAGIGVPLLCLAMGREGETHRKLLELAESYIELHVQNDGPHPSSDLWTLYQIADHRLADDEVASLVEQGSFLRHFWQTSGENRLSFFSQELVGYFGANTLKALFGRCIRSTASTAYWSITESPYILPIIAEKLPHDELALIFEIGKASQESCGYHGYIQAISDLSDRIEYMTEEARTATIIWAIRTGDLELSKRVAKYITPSIALQNQYYVGSETAGYLSYETLNSLFQWIDKHGSLKGINEYLGFVSALPSPERRPILLEIKADVFKIQDNGQLGEFIEAIKSTIKYRNRFAVRRHTRKTTRVISDGYLLESVANGSNLFWPFSWMHARLLLTGTKQLLTFAKERFRLLQLGTRSHIAIQQYA